MGADFYLDAQCAVRNELDNENIILMKKQMHVLENILQSNPEVEDESEVNGVRYVGKQKTEYSMTIADFKKIREKYWNLRDNHCVNCKYNLLADAMGCMGRINYPISMKKESLIFNAIIDNLQAVGEMREPFIESLMNVYPSELSTKVIAMYRQRGMMFQNPISMQASPDISKTPISSDCIWASYFFPHDSELPFGKESTDDTILIEYSRETLERLYNHATIMVQILERKLEDFGIASDPAVVTDIQYIQKYYKFIQFAYDDEVSFFMFP